MAPNLVSPRWFFKASGFDAVMNLSSMREHILKKSAHVLIPRKRNSLEDDIDACIEWQMLLPGAKALSNGSDTIRQAKEKF